MVNCDPIWRGGRAVEGAALEMLFRGNFNEGSNPSLSVYIAVLTWMRDKDPGLRQEAGGRRQEGNTDFLPFSKYG